MYAIEFETDIKSKYIELKNYDQLINKHAKVIILVEDAISSDYQANKLEEFKNLINHRKSLPIVDTDINIVNLCNEADSDIF